MAQSTWVRDNALYFPYINVHYDAWFGRILLYWDKVGSVVPEDYLYNPGKLEPVMKDLVSAGLVEQIVPATYAHKIENLTEPFLSYVVKQSEAMRQRRQRDMFTRRLGTTSLHIEKLGSISHELVRLGVARKERYPWFEVEDWAADAFMFFLTSMLGELDDIEAVPVTNEQGARKVARSVTRRRNMLIQQAVNAREDLLQALLPAPAHAPEVRELYDFKERYGHLLRRFRRGIEAVSIELANIDNPTLRQERARLFREDFEDQIAELSGAMRHSWTDLAFCRILPITGTGLGLAAVSGQPEIAFAAASASLLNAVYAALRTTRPQMAPDHPLAYVAHARTAFVG